MIVWAAAAFVTVPAPAKATITSPPTVPAGRSAAKSNVPPSATAIVRFPAAWTVSAPEAFSTVPPPRKFTAYPPSAVPPTGRGVQVDRVRVRGRVLQRQHAAGGRVHHVRRGEVLDRPVPGEGVDEVADGRRVDLGRGQVDGRPDGVRQRQRAGRLHPVGRVEVGDRPAAGEVDGHVPRRRSRRAGPRRGPRRCRRRTPRSGRRWAFTVSVASAFWTVPFPVKETVSPPRVPAGRSAARSTV